MQSMKIVGTNTLLECARNLLRRREITQAQFNEMEARNKKLPEERRMDVIVL